MKLHSKQKSNSFIFSWRGVYIVLSTTCLVTFYFAYIFSDYLTADFRARYQKNEINLFKKALKAGPLYFARMHSSETTQELLHTLMNSSSFGNGGFLEVKIQGGENGQYSYGSWINTLTSAEAACAVTQSFPYTDGGTTVYPIITKITYNTCFIPPEFRTLSKGIKLSIASILVIILAAILFTSLPILISISEAQKFVGKFPRSSSIPQSVFFKPIRDLLSLAHKGLINEKKSSLVTVAEQVAHDISSPVAAIDMIIKNTVEIPSEKKQIMLLAIQRIRSMSGELLEKSKNIYAEEGHTSTLKGFKKLHSSALKPLIDEIIIEKETLLDNKLQNPDISFSVNNLAPHINISIDANEFRRVISNLLDNSIEAFSEKTRVAKIDLLIQLDEKMATIKIKDNGRGISNNFIQQATKKGTSTKKGGSGLGLSYASNTIEQWGGKLALESSEGNGTTVSIVFPTI